MINIFTKQHLYFAIVIVSLFAVSCSTNNHSIEFRQFVLATGSPYELGLVTELGRAFEKKYKCNIRYVQTPTGPGLDLGRHGLAHIVIGHSHKATARLKKEGHVEKRISLMHNYTILIGPKNDPANVKMLKNLLEAYKKIASTKAGYLSRGDGGGMNMLEQKIWEEAKINPKKEKWYAVSGKFMLQAMLDADKNKQYHMMDSSTWTMYKSKCHNSGLLVRGPANEYEMCLISAKKHPNLKYNWDLAEKFFEFAISSEGQKIIADFGVKKCKQPLYYPDVIK